MKTDDGQQVGWYAVANIWFGGVVGLPALLLGSELTRTFTFEKITLIGFLGFAFTVGYMCLLSSKAVEHRMNAIEMAKLSFGETGANILVGLIVGISTLGWFGVLTGIVGVFFSTTMSSFGISISVQLSSILWGMVMTIASVLGFNYLKWLNLIAIPGILILIAYSLWISWEADSLNTIISYEPEKKIPFLKGIGMVIGLFSVGGLIAPDYNRFAASKKDAIWGSFLGLLPMGTALVAIGSALSILHNTGDITILFTQLGMPILALIILILITWTSNAMCLYSGGLGFTKAFHQRENKRPLFTLLCGIAGSVLAAMGILNNFTDLLLMLTAAVPPIAGVIIGSYYWGVRADRRTRNISVINWKGIIAWSIGVVFMIFIQSDIKNIVGIVVSGLLYIAIERTILRLNQIKLPNS